MMIPNAFTCTGPYAILIMCGFKQTENRSAWPELRDPPMLKLRLTSGWVAISGLGVSGARP